MGLPQELERRRGYEAPDVIEALRVLEAPMATKNSSAIWCRKPPGQPLARSTFVGRSRADSFLGFGAPVATVQRWVERRTAAPPSFFSGVAGAIRGREKPSPGKKPVDAHLGCLIFDLNEIENAFSKSVSSRGPSLSAWRWAAALAFDDRAPRRRSPWPPGPAAPARRTAAPTTAPRRLPRPGPWPEPWSWPARARHAVDGVAARERRSRTRWAARPANQRHPPSEATASLTLERAVERAPARPSICGASSSSFGPQTSPIASAFYSEGRGRTHAVSSSTDRRRGRDRAGLRRRPA